MKLALDFFPILLFFVAYKFANIYVATAVAIGGAVLQLAYARLILKRIDPMLWLSFGIVTIFGTLTLVLHNPVFIKWKPTVLYWSMGLGLVLSAFVFRRNLIRKMVGTQMTLPDVIWNRLNLAWAIFFILMGGANLLVAFNFSESTWVNFKLFGSMGLMVLFVIGQSVFLASYIKEDQTS